MIIEFSNESGTYELYTWYKIQAVDGVCPQALYMRITGACDNEANKLYILTKGVTGRMDVEFNDSPIP